VTKTRLAAPNNIANVKRKQQRHRPKFSTSQAKTTPCPASSNKPTPPRLLHQEHVTQLRHPSNTLATTIHLLKSLRPELWPGLEERRMELEALSAQIPQPWLQFQVDITQMPHPHDQSG
jgi:hypothetical protein